MAKNTTTSATTTRTKKIPGYRVMPALSPMHRLGFPYLGLEFLDASFERQGDAWCVVVDAKIGLASEPYRLTLSIDQALRVDVIEEHGCRCPVCGGRPDDPARIHGRR